jgi:glycosyltransferase involved in cell wall biosynthesis
MGPNNVKAFVKTSIWSTLIRIKNRPLIKSYSLRNDIKVRLVRNLGESALPIGDVIISSAWQTAEPISAHKSQKFKKKLYIAYDYEHFMTGSTETKERIASTYRSNLTIIASSTIVKETIESQGGTVAAMIPCGIDFDSFGIDIHPASRDPITIGFPVRRESFKGVADAITAANLLRSRYGDRLKISAFGSHKVDLPSWITWLKYPTQAQLREFYNNNAIFFVPSHFEGWGLPGCEAMACGAALVTTDNGGCRDYAINLETALVTPPMRPDLLAKAVADLIENDELRLSIAVTGSRSIRKFNWSRSTQRLNKFIT